MINKEEQYTIIYFPERMIEIRKKTYFALLDIDSNYSKFIQDNIFNIKAAAEFIAAKEKNRLHFDFGIILRKKGTKKIRKFIDGKET